VKTPQQIIEIYSQGWDAMEWLAKHAKTGQCRECANYHRRVADGGKPRDLIRLRCQLAQVQHRKYMAVKHLRLELNDGMDCDLKDGKHGCSGAAEWVLAERHPVGRKAGQQRQRGRMIQYKIGCEEHVRLAEARAVIEGDASRVSIEKLRDLSPEEAGRMT
jgi:hypothetical protein